MAKLAKGKYKTKDKKIHNFLQSSRILYIYIVFFTSTGPYLSSLIRKYYGTSYWTKFSCIKLNQYATFCKLLVTVNFFFVVSGTFKN
jgi:hypothetical protein